MLFLRFQVEDGNIHIPFPISTFWKLQENHGQISIISAITNCCWWCSINIIFPFYSIICIAIIYYCLKKKHIDYVSYDSETSQVKTASEMSQIRNTSGYVSPGTSSDTTL